jgi:hypothetical protein
VWLEKWLLKKEPPLAPEKALSSEGALILSWLGYEIWGMSLIHVKGAAIRQKSSVEKN